MSGTHDLSPQALQQYQTQREIFNSLASVGNAKYVHITRNPNDVIAVDFTRNPFISAEAQKPNPILNPASIQPFNKPNLYAAGFDRNGKMLFNQRTVSTFQPSQGLYQDIVTLEQTNNKFDVFEFLIPPEATTVFHSHTNGVEIFYVLGGETANYNNPNIPNNDDVVFELNADVDGVFNVADPNNPFSVIKDSEIEINGAKVTKGSFVAVPAGKIHTWANTGKIPARVIALIVPGGISGGFNRVGAAAGVYDPSPSVHPILAKNGTSNLVPTNRTPTEVNGLVPGDPNFYDFFQQVAAAPGVLEQLSFTNFPTTLPNAGPVVVYGVKADGSGAFQLNPSDDAGTGGVTNPQGGSALVPDNSPGVESFINAPVDPFAGSTFLNPFTVLRFGQNDGALNPSPMEVKLFSISSQEGEYSHISENHELFGVLSGQVVFEFGENGNDQVHVQVASEGDYIYIKPGYHFHIWASDQLSANSAKLIQFSAKVVNITDYVTAFQLIVEAQNLGNLTYTLESTGMNVTVAPDDNQLSQTDALFHNLIGLYEVADVNGAILDTFDVNQNGLVNDLLNPGDVGYARTAIANRVSNFTLQAGANGDPTKNTNSSSFGDVLLQGRRLYAPFVIANGGDLIPTNGSVDDGFNTFLAQNPNNVGATIENYINHAVAYFSFGSANPDGLNHLQNRGNNTFGFEDLPGNLGISDFDFNDAVFKFNFLA